MAERIKKGGMGCYLDPPTYPTHFWHVTGPGFSGSLESPNSKYEPRTQARIKALFDAWERPTVPEPEWIAQAFYHYMGAYAGHDGDYRTERSPDIHKGVMAIRKFYPEWSPTPAQWEMTKVSGKCSHWNPCLPCGYTGFLAAFLALENSTPKAEV